MTSTHGPITATPFEELTDEQVNSLTEADIDWYIRRARAEAGVPLLPVPVEPEYLPVPGPDVPTFHVSGEVFSDRDAAEAVQAVIVRHSGHRIRLSYGRDYSVRFVESVDTAVQVTTVMAYSTAAYAEHKAVLEENATRKNAYQNDRRAYDDAERKCSDIRGRIEDRIADVRERFQRVDMLADRFLEYRSIANGDDLMAMQFLVKAFDLTDEEIARVRSHDLVTASQS